MELLVILIVLVIAYLLITIKSELKEELRDVNKQLVRMEKAHNQLLQEIRHGQSRPAQQADPQPVEPPTAKPSTPERLDPPRPAAEARPQPVAVTLPKAAEHAPTTPVETHREPIIPPPPRRAEPQVIKTPPGPRPSFFERYPDLEKFIGENLINKIGIAILVLGIGYFVKYAIDNNWIGPIGRVGVGVLCGSIIVGFAHRLRNNYKAFSSVLAGGGLAIFYFTITLAYQQFHLFGQTPAFIILIGITIFAVALALLYNRQELAIIALVGGMGSPFMVSNGTANYQALFIYLVVLNAGLLIIAYFKAWRILNISAFGLTVILYTAVLWSINDVSSARHAGYQTALIYGSIFYLLFLFINIAHNVRYGKAFIASDYSILLLNTALYFSAGLFLLTQMNADAYRGAFCAVLAAINLVLSYILFRNKKVDANVLYLLIGITLTFISLTAPIQLHGHHITLFWASEAVLLYWLYQKSRIGLMRYTALLIWVLMLASLVMDWMNVYGYSDINPQLLTVLANKGFITTLSAAVGTYLLFVLKSRESFNSDGFDLSPTIFKNAALVLLFLSGLLEVNYQFSTRYPDTGLNVLYLMLYISLFVLLLDALLLRRCNAPALLRLILLFAAAVIYIAFISEAYNTQGIMLVKHHPAGLHFAVHWLSAVFVLLVFYRLVKLCRSNCPVSPAAACWVISISLVTFFSFEVSLISNWLFTSAAYPIERVQEVYIKTGLPVLWGLLSFALMWLGMKHKQRTIRIISLALFMLTLIKLFLFDIRNIPAAGKIVAFICLGALLLIISFMYQKLKKIITADEEAPNN